MRVTGDVERKLSIDPGFDALRPHLSHERVRGTKRRLLEQPYDVGVDVAVRSRRAAGEPAVRETFTRKIGADRGIDGEPRGRGALSIHRAIQGIAVRRATVRGRREDEERRRLRRARIAVDLAHRQATAPGLQCDGERTSRAHGIGGTFDRPVSTARR